MFCVFSLPLLLADLADGVAHAARFNGVSNKIFGLHFKKTVFRINHRKYDFISILKHPKYYETRIFNLPKDPNTFFNHLLVQLNDVSGKHTVSF